MIGVSVSFSDIQSAVSSFMSIPAVVPIVAAVVALALVPLVVNALYSIVSRR